MKREDVRSVVEDVITHRYQWGIRSGDVFRCYMQGDTYSVGKGHYSVEGLIVVAFVRAVYGA